MDTDSSMLLTDMIMVLVQSSATHQLLTINRFDRGSGETIPYERAPSKIVRWWKSISDLRNVKFLEEFCEFITSQLRQKTFPWHDQFLSLPSIKSALANVYISRSVEDINTLPDAVRCMYNILETLCNNVKTRGFTGNLKTSKEWLAMKNNLQESFCIGSKREQLKKSMQIVFPFMPMDLLNKFLISDCVIDKLTDAVRDVLTQQAGRITLGGDISKYSDLPPKPRPRVDNAARHIVNLIVTDLLQFKLRYTPLEAKAHFHSSKLKASLTTFFVLHFAREYTARLLTKLYDAFKQTPPVETDAAARPVLDSDHNSDSDSDEAKPLIYHKSTRVESQIMEYILKLGKSSRQKCAARVRATEVANIMQDLNEHVVALLDEKLRDLKLKMAESGGERSSYQRLESIISSCEDKLVTELTNAIYCPMTDTGGKSQNSESQATKTKGAAQTCSRPLIPPNENFQSVLQDEVRCFLQHLFVWLKFEELKSCKNTDVVSLTLFDIEELFSSVLTKQRNNRCDVQFLVTMVILHIKRYFFPGWEESICRKAITYLTQKLRQEIIGVDIAKRSDFQEIHRAIFKDLQKECTYIEGGQVVMALNEATSDRIIQNFLRHMQPPKKSLGLKFEAVKNSLSSWFGCNCFNDALLMR